MKRFWNWLKSLFARKPARPAPMDLEARRREYEADRERRRHETGY